MQEIKRKRKGIKRKEIAKYFKISVSGLLERIRGNTRAIGGVGKLLENIRMYAMNLSEVCEVW